MRILYICLGYCLAPFALALLAWRAVREGTGAGGLLERLGYGAPLPPGALWVHGASVGEVQAAAALIGALRARDPAAPVIVTSVTPAGRARAASLYAGQASVRYLPLDLPGAVQRFVGRANPAILIVLETEIWPTLYHACRRHGTPIVLASARLSARSARRYAWVRALTRAALAGVTVAAQSALDAERFAAIGVDPARLSVLGNLKFDVELPPQAAAAGERLRATLGSDRPVWVAGSTHEGEEAAVLAAHARLRARYPQALLVLAPRHPARFAHVAALLERAGSAWLTRSSGAAVLPGTEVLLLDTLGELVAFYAASDLAFVGGSLVPVGGHNLLEPAALGRPVLTGPWNGNAAGVAQLLIGAGALHVVHDAGELAARLGEYLADDAARARDGGAGRAAVVANRGALSRLLALVAGLRAARAAR
jgi:3-deoxy-D-manno-octulosonic-acid transferase